MLNLQQYGLLAELSPQQFSSPINGYTLGGPSTTFPTGWTYNFDSGGGSVTISSDSSTTVTDRIMVMTATTYPQINWTTPPPSTNHEILALVKLNLGGLSTAVLMLREDTGTGGNAYTMRFDEGAPNQVGVGYMSAGASNEFTSTAFTFSDGNWYWVRARVDGTASPVISIKVWNYGTTEPSSWTLQYTDTANTYTSAGYPGIRVVSNSSGWSLAYFSVGINGANAPSPPPAIQYVQGKTGTSVATISLVSGQTASQLTNGTSVSATLPHAPTAGNLVVVGVTTPSSTTVTVSDGTNSYTAVPLGSSTNYFTSSGGGGGNLYIFYLQNVPSGAGATITATCPGTAGNQDIFVAEFSGAATSNVYDTKATSDVTTATTTINTPTYAPNVAGELLFSVILAGGNVSSFNSPWTIDGAVASNGNAAGYTILTGSGSQAENATQSSGGYGVGIAGFKPATGGITIAATFNTAVASGDLVVGMVGWADPSNSITISSISDDQGNSYTALTKYNDSTSGISAAQFYLEGITNGPVTITVTFSATVSVAKLIIDEFSGLATSASLDVSTGQSTSGTGATASSGNVTTTASGDLIYGGFFQGAGSLTGPGSGFTLTESV